jgi:hypothetical protein
MDENRSLLKRIGSWASSSTPDPLAGGAVLAPDGRAFRYNRRETLLNGDFIALCDPQLPWKSWL